MKKGIALALAILATACGRPASDVVHAAPTDPVPSQGVNDVPVFCKVRLWDGTTMYIWPMLEKQHLKSLPVYYTIVRLEVTC
jgi:hypothetical protein